MAVVFKYKISQNSVNMNYLYLFIVLFACFQYNECYFITVDAHAEECFFDKVEAGTMMG